MKVSVKNFSVDMEVKNTGMELEIYSPDGETFRGDLIVTKSGLVWCEGRTRRENGKRITWDQFIEHMNAS